jgi:hypothetical protein
MLGFFVWGGGGKMSKAILGERRVKPKRFEEHHRISLGEL